MKVWKFFGRFLFCQHIDRVGSKTRLIGGAV